jgi:hypothetical protein
MEERCRRAREAQQGNKVRVQVKVEAKARSSQGERGGQCQSKGKKGGKGKVRLK